MKGIELPMNTLVVIVIAIIILIAMVALFMGVWRQGSYGISMDSAKNSACQRYVSLKYCDAQEDVGDGISIDSIKCDANELLVQEDLNDDGDMTDTKELVVSNLEDLAKYCFGGKTAASLCC